NRRRSRSRSRNRNRRQSWRRRRNLSETKSASASEPVPVPVPVPVPESESESTTTQAPDAQRPGFPRAVVVSANGRQKITRQHINVRAGDRTSLLASCLSPASCSCWVPCVLRLPGGSQISIPSAQRLSIGLGATVPVVLLAGADPALTSI